MLLDCYSNIKEPKILQWCIKKIAVFKNRHKYFISSIFLSWINANIFFGVGHTWSPMLRPTLPDTNIWLGRLTYHKKSVTTTSFDYWIEAKVSETPMNSHFFGNPVNNFMFSKPHKFFNFKNLQTILMANLMDNTIIFYKPTKHPYSALILIKSKCGFEQELGKWGCWWVYKKGILVHEICFWRCLGVIVKYKIHKHLVNIKLLWWFLEKYDSPCGFLSLSHFSLE